MSHKEELSLLKCNQVQHFIHSKILSFWSRRFLSTNSTILATIIVPSYKLVLQVQFRPYPPFEKMQFWVSAQNKKETPSRVAQEDDIKYLRTELELCRPLYQWRYNDILDILIWLSDYGTFPKHESSFCWYILPVGSWDDRSPSNMTHSHCRSFNCHSCHPSRHVVVVGYCCRSWNRIQIHRNHRMVIGDLDQPGSHQSIGYCPGC